jgi:hypothetical protein
MNTSTSPFLNRNTATMMSRKKNHGLTGGQASSRVCLHFFMFIVPLSLSLSLSLLLSLSISLSLTHSISFSPPRSLLDAAEKHDPHFFAPSFACFSAVAAVSAAS